MASMPTRKPLDFTGRRNNGAAEHADQLRVGRPVRPDRRRNMDLHLRCHPGLGSRDSGLAAATGLSRSMYDRRSDR